MAFLYELQSQLETMADEKRRGKTVDENHLKVIHTNLPVLSKYLGMRAYEGDDSYEQLKAYMKEAEGILSTRANKATLRKDAMVSSIIRREGKESFMELKKNNYNIKLEQFVTGADQQRMLDIVDNHIVPRSGIIYLTPRNAMGRAPFYSSEKIVGTWHVKTLWFNMGVILLMAVIAIVLLLTDCPGRYMRKEQ